MDPEFGALEELDRFIGTMAAAQAPPAVFKALQQASSLAAPRTAVFLLRQGELRGWGSQGYGPEVHQAQRSYTAPVDSAWLDRVCQTAGPQTAEGPDFGQPSAEQSLVCAVRIKGKPIAVVLAERSGAEEPWFPEAVNLLVTVAELRLELGLVLRKLQGSSSRTGSVSSLPEPASDPVPVAAPTAAPPLASIPPGPSVDEPDGIEPMSEPAVAESPELEAARRFARLVATDIRLYNEEAVTLGRRNGDLLKRLAEHINRGKETFLHRHADLGPAGLELLHDAFVQVLAAGDPQLIPMSALE